MICGGARLLYLSRCFLAVSFDHFCYSIDQALYSNQCEAAFNQHPISLSVYSRRSSKMELSHHHVPSAGIWRRGWDSNPRFPRRNNGFRDRPDRPLWHPSAGVGRRQGEPRLGKAGNLIQENELCNGDLCEFQGHFPRFLFSYPPPCPT